MVKKTNIAFDIDGVVINFTDAFLRVAREKFGALKNTTFYDVTRYQFYECLDISYEKCFEIVNYVIGNPFECNIGPVENAVEILTELSKDINLIFVTARKDIFKQQTKELMYHILPDVDKDKITIIHQKGSAKYQILNDLNIKYFIDDRSKNVRILNYRDVTAYLFTRPWNAKTRPDDFFTRINTWEEISNLTREIHSGKAN
jgi:uncharacterized HAD superfamily protein